MRHILTAEQFTPEIIERLSAKADEFREVENDRGARIRNMDRHKGRLAVRLFFEPSTRTSLSFQAAAHNLGIGMIGSDAAGEFSSVVKGETIEDTMRVLDEYGADAVILRTKEEGMAQRAANSSQAAIINAGDGKGEHPTQAALDVYTIREQLGRLNGLNIVIGGDLAHGRTARSLALLLSKYDANEISFVSTPELQIGEDIKTRLTERGTPYEETVEMHDALHKADVVYWTRQQLERHEGDPTLSLGQKHFVLDAVALDAMKKNAIILHPLPRNHEIPTGTDSDPRAQYFRQAGNGMYMRMAMLNEIMDSAA